MTPAGFPNQKGLHHDVGGYTSQADAEMIHLSGSQVTGT